MRARFSICCLILLALLAFTSVAQADLYLSSGKYQFTVRVQNSFFKDVQDARGMVWVNGTTARISVDAPGYRSGSEYVYLNNTQTYYSARVRLDDPMSSASVIDTTGKYVQGASADTYSQSMYWGDEFGVRATLPKAGYEKLTERLIDVRVNSLHAFAPRVYLSSQGDRWSVEVVVRRRDMQSFSNRLDIVVTADPATPSFRKVEPLIMVADYAANQKLAEQFSRDADRLDLLSRRLESGARQLRDVFPALDAGEQRAVCEALGPSTQLARELQSIETFNTLHR